MAARPQRPLLPLLSLLLFFITLLPHRAPAHPLQRQQDPVIEPIPDTETGEQPVVQAPSSTPSPTPSQSPSSSPIQPSPSPLPPTPDTSPTPIPSIPPTPIDQPPAATPSPTTAQSDIQGGDSRAAIIWGTLAAVLALIALLLACCCILFFRRRRRNEQPPPSGVYNTADPTVTPAPPPPPASYLNPDDARNLGPPSHPSPLPPAGPTATSSIQKAPLTGAGAPPVPPPIPRGPTPPPHDYVLGAGPAATRTDFIDIRTRFERDEIGDNSAVLGLLKPLHTSVPENDTPAAAATATAAAAAPAQVGASHDAHPPPPELPPPPTAIPAYIQQQQSETRVDETLPDREGQSVPITFDSQERLMAGGDGSGAISDAAMSLNAGSIAEESGDVPSLERDPITISRDRDTTF